jgi:Apea-like HEPN
MPVPGLFSPTTQPRPETLLPLSKDVAKELRPLARAFLEAYQAAVVKTDEDFLRVVSGDGGYHEVEGGLVELTEHVTAATDALIDRAINLIGPKGESERAFTYWAEETGKEMIKGGSNIDSAVTKLLDRFADEANSSFELILPNYLIEFEQGARSFQIGPVRAALSEDVSLELEQRDFPIRLAYGKELGITFEGDTRILEMPRSCWVVKVAAARDNVSEESKWLIDVASSLLRMSYRIVSPMFPIQGDVEPHPTTPWYVKGFNATLGPKQTASTLNHGIIKSYEIDQQVEATGADPAFVARAKMIFDPPSKSLAERVQQGLGWLTRGRQSADRAERLLYTFTAIEALLSSDDKTAPVTQTIARHAATILSDDPPARYKTAALISSLYASRSKVVHKGNRPVVWTQAKQAQSIAEHLFSRVLHRVDLSMKFTDFTGQLSVASYGSPWPPQKPPEDEA